MGHVQKLREVTPKEAVLVLGWHLDGAGPARYGWAWLYPTGKKRFLGRTAFVALERLKSNREIE